MEAEEKPEQPTVVWDINAWMAHEEQAKQGMSLLVPPSEEELESRRSLITRTSGSAPDIYLTPQVEFEIEVLEAWIEQRRVQRPRITNRVLDLVMSKGAHRAIQVENMHTLQPRPVGSKSLAERFFGRK